jgi:hypothetical protein
MTSAIDQVSMTRKLEFGAALLITVLVAWLHFARATHAGGLWRDEAGAVQVALMPSVYDITQVFQHEAFPLLFPLTLRTYAAFAGTSDTAFRIFGLLVGLGILAALWMTAKAVIGGVPLLSLALLGVNASVIQWADSVRGYGLGIVLMVMTIGLIWRVVTSPSTWVVCAAALAAICSVQTLFYNAIMLFAIGIAGAAVAARNRHWNRALLVLGIGLIAAVSLIPYIPSLQSVKEWNMIFTSPDYTLPLFWSKLSETLSSGGRGIRWLWLALVIATAAAGTIVQFRSVSSQESDRRDVGLYCVVALLLSIPTYFVFLKALGYPTHQWYYLALIALVAVAADGAWSAFPWPWWGDAGRMLLALGVVLWSFLPTWSALQTRQTNLDTIAAKLEKAADAGDVIVVDPWYFGVTFERYYKGAAQWMTLPPLADHRIHRYDLMKERMAARKPLDPVLEAMANALSSGKRVWMVGNPTYFPRGTIPPILAPAPDDSFGWDEIAYRATWSIQAKYLLETCALETEVVPLPSDQPISPYENAKLIMARGWRSP